MRILLGITLLIGFFVFQERANKVYKSGIDWKEPVVVTPGERPSDAPSDAVVLFGGTDLSEWRGGDRCTVAEGAFRIGDKGISTKRKFDDFQLHLEWSCDDPPKGESQKRGNSGIYIMGRYEIQILDSYGNQTYFDGQAASVYKQTPPAVNAMKPPGQWNTYDIFWTAPRFNPDETLKSPAFVTVVHNGVLVINHFKVKGNTAHNKPPGYKAHGATGPINLQKKLQQVRFRNIWVRDYRSAQVNEPADGDTGEKSTGIEK